VLLCVFDELRFATTPHGEPMGEPNKRSVQTGLPQLIIQVMPN
jgi:hypothetical protein